ncbi:MAG: primosomal protein N' [SAR202 cluster bacterium Io17-Chloro-G2]|nr:MAG: primosomal protein N' [SAR202 cluster bacterium Io17-Chloro-G2]
MSYAEVAVDAPVGPGRTFSYSIPRHMSLEPGQLVWVPFGRRTLQGVVMSLAGSPQVDVTRDVLQPVEPSPVLSSTHLQLALWLSRYYLCSLFAAVGLMLPPGFEARVRSRITALSGKPPDSSSQETLRPQSQEALEHLDGKAGLSEAEFVKLLGRSGDRELTRLIDKGYVSRRVDLPRPLVSPKYRCFLVPAATPGKQHPATQSQVMEIAGSLPARQQALLMAIRTSDEAYPASSANKLFGYGVARALVDKGIVAMDWVREDTTPYVTAGDTNGETSGNTSGEQEKGPQGSKLTLTAEQAGALDRIRLVLNDPPATPRSFLLHGVTGSGKTEVYLRAIQTVVDRGDQAIFLVPEISLTPQTLERVNQRFPGRVAVLHSGLTQRQKFDRWWEIREGAYDVVVGPRSSLFAPVPRLGLIVIDEEHEWTYKQEESQPLYHARSAALELSRLTGAVVLMGSATPDVETYQQARRGGHRLLELPQRIRNPERDENLGPEGDPEVASEPNQPLAQVEICDMRQELREGNRSIFSVKLAGYIEECLKNGQQTILFLNRRGSTPIVQCRDCGYVATCSRCSVSLTYHSSPPSADRLVCHRCNRRGRMPRRCRQCGGEHIRQLGIGTQRVLDAVLERFPGVRVDRWDADTTRSGSGPGEVMARLTSGETQVLVGTQMVAKGLDIPNVTLVGVILADVGLFVPDFRSGERNFGLLCQVAGRAGRGAVPGKVVIQTYRPSHYAVVAAAAQDYASLFDQEIKARYEMGNPPYNRLAHLVWQDTNDGVCQRRAATMARQLRQEAYAQGLTDVQVIGPAPGIPARLRGKHRWHLLIRGRNLHRFLEGAQFPPGCTVDIDPVHVL